MHQWWWACARQTSSRSLLCKRFWGHLCQNSDPHSSLLRRFRGGDLILRLSMCPLVKVFSGQSVKCLVFWLRKHVVKQRFMVVDWMCQVCAHIMYYIMRRNTHTISSTHTQNMYPARVRINPHIISSTHVYISSTHTCICFSHVSPACMLWNLRS